MPASFLMLAELCIPPAKTGIRRMPANTTTQAAKAIDRRAVAARRGSGSKGRAAAKPKIIKEIKSMLGLSLVDSKKFVESAPKMMKEGVPKEEGEKIVETLKGLGAVVVME